MSVGSFTVTTPNFGGTVSSAGTLSFATANFDPPGALPDQLESIQEELTDTGVSGRRWRQVYKQFAPFRLMTVSDEASYVTAVQTRRNYQNCKGTIGKLSITMDGVSYTFASVKVTDVSVRVQKGFLVGSQAITGSAAIIYGMWTMVLADVNKQGVS